MKGLSILRTHLAEEHKRLHKLTSARRIHNTPESVVLQEALDTALSQALLYTEALLVFEVGRETPGRQ